VLLVRVGINDAARRFGISPTIATILAETETIPSVFDDGVWYFEETVVARYAPFLTRSHVARVLRIGQTKLKHAIETGRIEVVRYRNRLWIPGPAVERYRKRMEAEVRTELELETEREQRPKGPASLDPFRPGAWGVW